MIARKAMPRKILGLLLFSALALLARAEDADSCGTLEAQLKTDAASVELHQKLIDCYFHAEIQSPSRRAEIEKERAAQVLWLVQHAPEAKFAGLSQANIDAYRYPEDYTEIKNEWMAQVKAHSKNAQVLVNAVHFMELTDVAKAEELASSAHSLEPHNVDAALTLAQIYHLKAI